MSWQETIGKNLIKNVEVKIGDNTTKVENIDGKLKVDHYYKDILQKTENENVEVSIGDNKTYLPLSAYFMVDGKLKTENKNVEVSIGDNKTKVENTDGKLKVESIRICVDTINASINSNRDRDLRSSPPIPKKIISPWMTPLRLLDKQTYTEKDLIKNLELIGKHPECITEKYDTIDWTDLTYDNIIDIADYIYEDYIKDGQDGLCFFCFIYNNILVYIQNDSEISKPYIEFKYVKSQINESDLNTIKKAFNFLNKN